MVELLGTFPQLNILIFLLNYFISPTIFLISKRSLFLNIAFNMILLLFHTYDCFADNIIDLGT